MILARLLPLALVLLLAAPASAQLGGNILKLVNEPSGTAPQLAASGLDANIDVNLVPKGTGCVRISGGACIGGGGTGTVTGSGTTGKLPKWLNGPGSVLGDSIISESAGVATVTGSLIVTTRAGTPAKMAVFTSGGLLAETTLPTTGTVTSIATTSPITGGTITTSGTIGCATCATGTFTTGLFPVATAAHTLGDSVFGQNTSALVAAGSTAAVGGIGFNQAGNVEVVADGSTVVNTGLLAGTKSDFTIHDSTTENNFQFSIYNDDDGRNNFIVIQNYGAYPNNSFQIGYGDGAGGVTADLVRFTPTLTRFSAPNFAAGGGGATVSGTDSTIFNVGTAFYGLGTNNTFAVVRSAAGQQYDNMIFAQKNNQTSMINFETTNNVVGGISAVCAGDASGTCGGNQTRGVASFDAQDATNIVTVSVLTNPNVVKLTTNQTGAGSAPEFQWWTPGGLHSYVSLKAPDTTASDLGVKMILPSAYPSVTGQPLVGTTVSGGQSTLNFAAGVSIGAADVTVVGHYLSSTTTPAVTNTTANSCGTTAATIVGTDVAGKVTVGATAGTSCTVTFTTAFANAPACTVTNETTANLSRATSTTTTVILAGTFVAGDKLAYICLGRV